MAEPRVIDALFELHARLRAVGEIHGTRSEEYAQALDELHALRRVYEEERHCRPRLRLPES